MWSHIIKAIPLNIFQNSPILIIVYQQVSVSMWGDVPSDIFLTHSCLNLSKKDLHFFLIHLCDLKVHVFQFCLLEKLLLSTFDPPSNTVLQSYLSVVLLYYYFHQSYIHSTCDIFMGNSRHE